MIIQEIRKMTGMSRAAFSERYGIPKRTLENWENGVATPPDYVIKMLDRIVREDIKSSTTENRIEASYFKVMGGKRIPCTYEDYKQDPIGSKVELHLIADGMAMQGLLKMMVRKYVTPIQQQMVAYVTED